MTSRGLEDIRRIKPRSGFNTQRGLGNNYLDADENIRLRLLGLVLALTTVELVLLGTTSKDVFGLPPSAVGRVVVGLGVGFHKNKLGAKLVEPAPVRAPPGRTMGTDGQERSSRKTAILRRVVDTRLGIGNPSIPETQPFRPLGSSRRTVSDGDKLPGWSGSGSALPGC